MGAIKRHIEDAAAKLGLRYFYGSWARLNKDLDAFAVMAERETAVLHIEHTQGSVTFSEGAYYTATQRTEQVNLGLGRKIPFDYDSGKVNAVVDTILRQGTELIRMLNEAMPSPVDNVGYQVLYDHFDANLVVVMFNFTAQEEAEC